MTDSILILGATSGIGARAVESAVQKSVPVRAFARSADTLEATSLVTPIKGDALQAEDLDRALEGASAVIYALGIRERLAMIWQEESLFSRTTALLLERIQAVGVDRLVTITGFGAGRSRQSMSLLERTGHGAILGKVYADKSRQEALIMDSPLDWTIARPVILTNRPASGQYRVLTDPKTWRNGIISRADVGDYAVSAVLDGLNIRQDVVLTR